MPDSTMPQSHCRTHVHPALLSPACCPDAAAQVPAPEAFFGFKMGTDGRLADWASITKYFETVAAASPRVELVDVGPTTEGRRIIGAIISSPRTSRTCPPCRRATACSPIRGGSATKASGRPR